MLGVAEDVVNCRFILGIICEDDDGVTKDQFSGDQVRFVQPLVAPPPRGANLNNNNNDEIASVMKVPWVKCYLALKYHLIAWNRSNL